MEIDIWMQRCWLLSVSFSKQFIYVSYMEDMNLMRTPPKSVLHWATGDFSSSLYAYKLSIETTWDAVQLQTIWK